MDSERTISLVLLPGLDGTGELFDPLIAYLADWINPIVVSYPKDEPYGYQELETIVAKALPIDTDYVILGESFSGPLAVMIAAERPSGLKGVILCATFVKKPFKTVPSWLSVLSVSPIYQLWPATIRLRAMLGSGKFKQLVDMALNAIQSVSPAVIAERVKAILTVNVEQELRNSDLPLLYLASLRDHLIKKHNLAGIRKIRPDVKVIELDTQHFILQLEPEKSAQAIEEFLRSISQSYGEPA